MMLKDLVDFESSWQAIICGKNNTKKNIKKERSLKTRSLFAINLFIKNTIRELFSSQDKPTGLREVRA